jgi:O-antigen/teichoic acid export membrane protein
MKRLLAGASVLAAAQLGGQLIGLVMLVLVSRRIGPTYLGAYAFSLNIVTYAGLATTIGLPALGMRQVSQGQTDRHQVLVETTTARTILALIIGAGLVAAAPLIASSDASRSLIPILSIKLLSEALTFDWYLQAEGHHAIVAKARFVGQIAYALVLLPLLASGLVGARHYAIANVLGLVVTSIIMLWAVLRQGRIVARAVSFRAIRQRVGRSLPFAWWTALTLVYYSTDLILVAYIAGDRAAGLYAAASKMPLSILQVAALWFTVSMPETARLHSATDRDKIRRQTRIAATTAIVAGLPFVLLGPVFASALVTTIFGARFAGASPALAILSVSVAVTLVQIVVTSVVMGAGRERPYVRAMSIGAGTNVVLNLALIPIIGIIGAALATIIAETIVLAAGIRQMSHIAGRPEVNWHAVSEASIVAVLAALVSLLIRIEVGFVVAAGAAVLVCAVPIVIRTIRDPHWTTAWLGGT